jgi:hypothetical protein
VEDDSIPGGRRLSSQAFAPDDSEAVSLALECVLDEMYEQPSRVLDDFPGMGLAAAVVETALALDDALTVNREPTPREPWHGLLRGVRRRPKSAQKEIEGRLAALATQQMLVFPSE